MSRLYIIADMLLVAVLAWTFWPDLSILASPRGSSSAALSSVSCPVTRPNGGHPPGQSPSQWYRGSNGLWTILWPRGTATVPPQNVQRDGRLYVKFPWWRGPGSHGTLTARGRRLDKSAPALRAVVPAGYGNTGFQVSAILFTTVGCWQVTGRAGEGRLTIVMRVLKTSK
jgi:hypothetical protein